MRISHTCRRVFSAAVSAVMAAVLLVPSAAPVTASTITVGKELTTKDGTNAYRGKIADLATSGLKTISVYVTADAPGETEVSLSYGFGVSLDKSPWWIELDHGEFKLEPDDKDDTGTSIKIPANKSTPVKVDVSKVSIKYETGQYPGEFEFRNYYCGGTLTVDKIVPNDTGSSSDPGPATGPGTTAKSGSYTFTDNKDGTGTLKTTLTGTIDDLDFLLTAGKSEEDYEDSKGNSTWKEGDPINSRKLYYSEFGLPKPGDKVKVTPESFTFAVESETNMDTFMFGCGLNVEYKSPADTEYWLNIDDDPDTNKGYWYNEHGDDEDGNPTIDADKLEVKVGKGTTLENCGKYVEATWNVPDDIKEYVLSRPSDSISFQFWYGAVKKPDYKELKSVTLKSATCTYTVETTFPFTDDKTVSVSKSLKQSDEKGKTASIPFEDFDFAANDKLRAVVFNVTCPTTIKKLVFGVTISDKASADEYTQMQYAVLEAGKTTEIAIPIPESIEPDLLYGNLGFGYYYGADSSDSLVSSITLNSVKAIYEKGPEETTTTTVTTTTVTTTTEALTADWGNADCKGIVDVSDAVLIARFVAEDSTASISVQGKLNADVNHNGKPDSGDIVLILKYIAKLVKYSDLEP